MEEVLFVILGLLVAFNVGHFLTLRRCEGALLALTMESRKLTDFDPGSILEDVREEVVDVVTSMVNQMRPPTVADHLGGVVAQFAQMRMMKMLREESGGLLDVVSPSIGDESTLD